MHRFMAWAALIFLAIPSGVLAHGVWVAERAGDPTIIFGHGARDYAYEPEKVTAVIGITALGDKIKLERAATKKNVTLVVPSTVVAIAMNFDNGFWIRKADKQWVVGGKQQAPGGRDSHHAVKYSTHVVSKLAGPFKPTGAALEIIPLQDPLSLKAGAVLPVQVLLLGKPLRNVRLEADYVNRAGDKTAAKTDSNGRVGVRIANEGLNVLAVEFDQKTPSDPNVDVVSHLATLSFVLPHKD